MKYALSTAGRLEPLEWGKDIASSSEMIELTSEEIEEVSGGNPVAFIGIVLATAAFVYEVAKDYWSR